MNATFKQQPSDQAQIVLEALKRAVANTLERKRLLGQYAVVWHDGKAIKMGEDRPENHTKPD